MDLVSDINPGVIKSLIDSGMFWDYFEISLSPGDGHCLLHSIVSSMASQNQRDLTLSQLTNAIVNETTLNSTTYEQFINGSKNDLIYGMKAYVD